MQTLVVTSSNIQKLKVVKQLLKALDLPYKAKNNTKYSAEFVEKLENGLKQIESKQTVKLHLDEIWK